MTNHRRSKRFLFSKLAPFLAVVLLLGGCQKTVTEFSEGVATKEVSKRLKATENEKNDQIFEVRLLLTREAALLAYKKESAIPNSTFLRLQETINAKAQEAGFFVRFQGVHETGEQLRKEPKMVDLKDGYLETLTHLSISNRDQGAPIGEYLKSDGLLVFEVNFWPCTDCDSKDVMSFKLRLVEPKSGQILWTGVLSQTVHDLDPESLESVAVSLTEQLGQKFQDRFKQRWHIVRYRKLAQIAME